MNVIPYSLYNLLFCVAASIAQMWISFFAEAACMAPSIDDAE